MDHQELTTRTPRRLAALAALGCFAVLAACGGDHEARSAETGKAAGEAAAGAVVVAGVSLTPPDDWTDVGAAGMRQAQFHLAPVAGDNEPAEMAIFYFGQQSGGGVEANIQRWIGQMSLPDGGDPARAAERSTFAVGGMSAHLVVLDGTYSAGGMGGPAGGGLRAMPGYRLVGVVLEGPEGNLFFKLTGPVPTARAMQEGLLAMVRGARSAG